MAHSSDVDCQWLATVNKIYSQYSIVCWYSLSVRVMDWQGRSFRDKDL